ncbi:MAG: OmpA family protein [Marinilabiliaceae bacterium]|nr:OmpA family protein [Marinilabiliaceae bacterium]
MRNKIKYIILVLLMTSIAVDGQRFNTKSKKAIELFKKSEIMYVKGQFQNALLTVDEAIKKDTKFIDAYLLKAEILQVTKQFQQQKDVLIKALELDSAFFLPTFFNIGKAEFYLGNYNEAIEWFKKYQSKPGASKSAINPDEWIIRAEFAKDAVEKKRQIVPINMGEAINSSYDEYWPSLTADEQTLVFTVMIPKDTIAFKMGNLPKSALYYQEDFYFSQCNNDGQWFNREAIQPPLNSDQNEGAQSLSADGNWMFFTGCGRPKSMGSCDIYFSQRTENGWAKPVNLGSSLNTPYWESQPSFSADGQTLYFVSNKPGGYGGRDIYSARVVSLKDDGTPIFAEVKNMGPVVNTAKDENSPFIHPDNKTLFFSTDGWPGMGEMDIFYSVKNEEGIWSQAKNVGYPINTNNDEIGFIVNAKGDKAYYSTDGFSDSFGGKDIYTFELPEDVRPSPVSYVKGFVYDAETNKRISAKFELLSLRTGKLVATTNATKYSGQFLLCLPSGENYAFNVSKSGYLFYSDHFDLKENYDASKPKLIDIYLNPIKAGQIITLKNVFFETDSYMLRDESKVELDRVCMLLNENTDIKIEVQGHTDNIGSAAYNNDLSQKRANEVVNYLISKGIDKKRLASKGYGFSKAIESNDTEQGRAKNRRTEMMIIE